MSTMTDLQRTESHSSAAEIEGLRAQIKAITTEYESKVRLLATFPHFLGGLLDSFSLKSAQLRALEDENQELKLVAGAAEVEAMSPKPRPE